MATRIDLRTAINSVMDYFSEFKDILGNNLKDLAIEETELSDDEKFWLITIGFDREVDPTKEKIYGNNLFVSDEMANLLKKQKFNIERIYKTFTVNSSTGEVISMKIYKL